MSPQKSTSPRACSIGLPISFTRIAASVSRRSRWSSPTRLIISARSPTEREVSASRASQALAIAASSSSSEISGYSSSFSPVAGLTTAYMLTLITPCPLGHSLVADAPHPRTRLGCNRVATGPAGTVRDAREAYSHEVGGTGLERAALEGVPHHPRHHRVPGLPLDAGLDGLRSRRLVRRPRAGRPAADRDAPPSPLRLGLARKQAAPFGRLSSICPPVERP